MAIFMFIPEYHSHSCKVAGGCPTYLELVKATAYLLGVYLTPAFLISFVAILFVDNPKSR